MSVVTKVIFVAVFLIGMCTSAQIPQDMCLGSMDGFLYLDPNDCSGYIECRKGVVTMQQCPAGESFELSLYYCMISSHVECGTRAERPSTKRPSTMVSDNSIPTLSTSTMLPDSSVPTLLPSTFPSIPIPPGVQHIMCRGMPEGIMLPNPDRCRAYIECRVGVRLDRNCNAGDLFDARVGFCLPDYVVDCGTRDNNRTPTTRGPPIRPSTIGAPTPHTRPPQSSSTRIPPTRIPPSRPVTNPPTSDSQVCSGMTDGMILMNPKICRSYYECNNNQVIDRECNYGEYFDIRVNLCLDGSVVDCGSRTIDDLVIIPQIPGSPTTEKSIHDVCSEAKDGTRFADTNQCNYYFECQRNFRIERYCKPSEMFDLRLKMCLPAEHVDCGLRNHYPNQEAPEQNIFPSCKSAGVYFLPHPLDCEAYFICANGILIQHSCAPGVFFNSEISKCDKPHNTNCNTVGPSTNSPPIIIPQTPPTPNCRSGQQFFPSLANCAHYYICISGTPMLMSCPRDTLWNTRIMQCDTPNNVRCAQKYNVLTESDE